jgi:hypothetical protein
MQHHPIWGDDSYNYYRATHPDPVEREAAMQAVMDGNHATIDLTQSEDAIHKGLRKSYCSLVNWGRRNLTLRYGSYLLPQYRALHAKVAGRITRGDESWNAMHDMLWWGSADLIMGYLNNEAVAGNITFYGKEGGAFYASAAYIRELKLPLGHYMVWMAILRAKELGLKTFDMGRIDNAKTPKEEAIIHFRKGFV